MTTTQTGVSVERESTKAILSKFASTLALNAAIPLKKETSKPKGDLGREAASIFAREIEKDSTILDMSLADVIKAADVTDTSIGLLAGTLVLQRTLPLLQFEYPVLAALTTDFSDAPGLFNQTETTRITLKPAVQSFDPTPDSTGRPKGWSQVSPAQSVNVSITLDEYVSVPIVFGVEMLAQTVRRLFQETSAMAIYALGGRFVRKLTALLTAANYNAYKATSVAAVTTVSGSTSVTVTTGDTTGMYPGQAVSDGGTNIPATCYVASITDSTHFVMTQKAIGSNTGVALTLGPGFDDSGAVLAVPNLYSTYSSAIADFNLASLGQIHAALSSSMVPLADRSVLLNSSYYNRLAQDESFNTFFATMKSPEIITEGKLPRLQGFNPIESPWFPSSSNYVGFAFHRAAAVLKSRLPNDFTQAIGATIPGSVTTVTAPGGISVLLVQYVNLQGNYAEWRPEIMLGAALGDRRAGLVVTSQ